MNMNNTYPCLLVSTSHVPAVARDMMDKLPLDHPEAKNRVFVRDSGWFVKLLVCDDQNDEAVELAFFESLGFSSEQLAIIGYALKERIPMVEFDMDADALPGYVIFED